MHFTPSIATLILAFTAVVSAAPSAPIAKRASVTDACDVGFCTLNGGTTGGASGSTVHVSSIDELNDAATSDGAKVIVIDSSIESDTRIRVSSDKTIIGAPGAELKGVGFYIKDVNNVIMRNLKISKVLADTGDAIGIQKASNVWVDHCDLSSDMDHGKDFYDGLLDITHAAEFVTVSNTYLHDHFKASLIGHSDNNGDEDKGHLHVTYANNFWQNINSRAPSIRFGTGHIFNSYFLECNHAINSRMGAEVLVQSTVFDNCGSEVIQSVDSDENGSVAVEDVDLGSSKNTAPSGSLSASDLGYDFTLLGSGKVKSAVQGTAGATLSF